MKYNLLRFNTFVVIISSFFLSLPVFAEPINPSQCVKIVSNSTSGTIALARSVSDKLPTYENATDLTLWYSKNNGVTWTRWTDPSVKITFSGCSPDKTILLKGANPSGFGHPKGNSSWRFINNSYTFTFTGNIMSLIDTLNLDGSEPIPAYCFDKLFSNYTQYLGAGTDLILPAQTLSEGCYFQMFKGCTSITKTPDLSVATNAPIYSMQGMFQGCTKLTTIQGLPQTDIIGEEAMLNMFYNCTALNSANVPTITAKYIDRYGCHQMFALCSSANFVTPPTMPNLRNIAERGCEKMYFQCTSLTSSTCLNHLEVVKPYGCYLMFDSCLKMTTIDTIKARRLEDHACARMFYKTSYKTSASTKAKAIIVDTVGTYGCYQMFHGNFTTPSDHYDNALTAIDSLRFRIIEDHGCEQMCYMCTLQLKTIPNMRGIKRVGAYGCSQMFYGCPKINYIGSIEIDTIGDYGCSQMFYNACSSANSTINKLEFDVIGSHGCEKMFFNAPYALRDAEDSDWTFSSIGDYGCAQMFVNLANNRTLRIPAITATTVGDHGMYRMFYTCHQIVEMGKLTIRNLGDYGCYQMYADGLTGLTPDVDAIKIDTIGSYGCAGMFYSTFWNYDSRISVTPTIETKLIKDHGCYQMFYGNRRLTTISDISAQKLMDYACAEMFHRTCSTTLVSSATVGKIKADTIGNYGMYRMFSGDFLNTSSSSTHYYHSKLSSVDTIITKLIRAHGCERMFECCSLALATSPAIKAQRIEEKGCYQMFWTNGSLTRVKPITVDTICSLALNEMFTSCGAINTIGNLTADTIGENGCTNMFNSSLASGCAMGNITAVSLGNQALYQMFNGRPLGSVGNISITRAHDESCYQMFNGCTALTAAGNISVGATTDYSLCRMFQGCTGMTIVGGLTIGNISNHACELMFYNCNKLPNFTNTPSLPSDKIDEYGCYRMFEKCSLLVASPVLSASQVGKYGYAKMFLECTSLTTATTTLPTLTLDSCTYYQMFAKCSSLSAGPSIAATTYGAYACDSMFAGCGLTTIPDMNAVQTIGNFACKEMFRSCTSLPSVGNKAVTSIGNNGCRLMFGDCTGLTSVTNLTSGTIGDYGCQQMFAGCTGITSVSDLSATNIGEHGCELMFYNNKKITTISDISATNVGSYGCARMFYGDVQDAVSHSASNLSFTHIGEYGCYRMLNVSNASSTNRNYLVSLDGFSAETIGPHGCQEMCTYWESDAGSSADAFKATTLATITHIQLGTLADYACYRMFAKAPVSDLGLTMSSNPVGNHACEQMFIGCTALPSNKLPLLPATIVGDYGYANMFNGCSGLTSTQTTLPATTLGEGAYEGMFSNCGSLTTIPSTLPATTIPDRAYFGMFQNCTSLNSVPTLPATSIGDYGYSYMFKGCTALRESPSMTLDKIGNHGCEYMFANCSTLTTIGRLQVDEVMENGCAYMFLQSVCNQVGHSLDIVVSLSINKVGNYGCLQMFYCNGTSTSSTNDATGRIKRVTELNLREVGIGGCQEMFRNNRYLTSVPEALPALDIDDYAYYHMFYDNIKLAKAPILPATRMTTGCYRQMFRGCTSFTETPVLSSTDLAPECYYAMFQGCTGLQKAPALPATKMKELCYANMFLDCGNSFSQAPNLPATELAQGCYQSMFKNCTGLRTTMEILPATKLANNCYYNMFYGCTGITQSPILSAPLFEDADGNATVGAYYQMFYECNALNTIRTYLEDWGTGNDNSTTGNTYKWVGNVNGSGTFVCPESLEIKYSSSTSTTHFAPKYSGARWTVVPIQRLTFNTNGGTWDGTNSERKVMSPPLTELPIPMKDNCIFLRWDLDPAGETGFELMVNNILEGDNNYYAIYQPIDYDVVRWTSNGLVVHTTMTSATSCVTRVENTAEGTSHTLTQCAVPNEQGEYFLTHNTQELMDNAGKLMYIVFKDNNNKVLGTYAVHIPYIIVGDVQSSSLTQTASSDVWVTTGSCLTVNDDRSMKTLYVEGGAKLVVPEDGVLHTDNIVLRAGCLSPDGTYSFCYPQLVANGSIYNASGLVNLDYTLDRSQFYSISLPGTVDLGDVSYEDGSSVVAAKSMQVQCYDGSLRAARQSQSGWVDLWHPNKNSAFGPYPQLMPGVGYIVTAQDRRITMEGTSAKVRRTHTTLRFPMKMDLTHGETCDGDVRVVSVHPWGMTNGVLEEGVRPNNAGWNLVGNPFLANIVIGPGLASDNGIGLLDSIKDASGELIGFQWVGNNRYAVIPSNDGQDFEQIQLSNNTLPAFKNFFIQIGSGDVLSFPLNKRAKNTPSRAWELDENSEQMIGIRLEGRGKSDRLGILLSNDYTDAYEFNADLDKWKNKSLNIFARIGDYDLGMAALSPAIQSIPLGVGAATMGEYTFSIEEEWTSNNIEIGHLYLEDMQENTITDLLQTDYTCSLTASSSTCDRFRLIPKGRQVPTDISEKVRNDVLISAQNDRISIVGVHNADIKIYTIMGMCVYEGTPEGDMSLSLPIGTYLVSVSQNGETITKHVLLH